MHNKWHRNKPLVRRGLQYAANSLFWSIFSSNKYVYIHKYKQYTVDFFHDLYKLLVEKLPSIYPLDTSFVLNTNRIYKYDMWFILSYRQNTLPILAWYMNCSFHTIRPIVVDSCVHHTRAALHLWMGYDRTLLGWWILLLWFETNSIDWLVCTTKIVLKIFLGKKIPEICGNSKKSLTTENFQKKYCGTFSENLRTLRKIKPLSVYTRQN